MLIVSSRREFWDSDRISNSPADMIADVELGNMGVPDTLLNEADFKDRVKDKKVLLLVHGYNNDPDDISRAYSTIEAREAEWLNHYDMVVGYSWPGGDQKFDYFAAKDRSGAVSGRFANLFTMMDEACQSVDIMAHSMGCRVALRAFESLQSRHQRTGKANLLLMAAAVDDESIERDERYFRGSQYCDSTYVFYSRNDPVLRTAYRLAEWDSALGLRGPEDPAGIDPKVKVINCKRVIKGHGDYKNSLPVFQFLQNQVISRTSTDQLFSL